MTDDNENAEAQEEGTKPVLPGAIHITISDLLGLGKATETLSPGGKAIAAAVGKFFGVVANPAQAYLQYRAESAAHRHETLANVRAATEIDALLSEEPVLSEHMKARLIATELRRQRNIRNAAQHAIELAEGKSDTEPAHEIDEDFMAEWVDGVKDVSNEYVQKIWSSLLANAATTKAGRVSKPSLDLLKSLDYSAAKSFETFTKIWRYAGPPAIRVYEAWTSSGTDVDFQLLKELGFIERVDGVKSYEIAGIGRIGQSGKRLRSNLGLSAISTISIWTFGTRAAGLAEALFADHEADDQEFGYKALRINLEALADDTHQHLCIELHEPSGTEIGAILISHAANRFTSPESDGALSEESRLDRKHAADWLEAKCSSLASFTTRTLQEFALDGRLKIENGH